MTYRVWYDTESRADYFIANTALAGLPCEKVKLAESDASKPRTFHAIPDHIKQILYLDSPDIIVERDGEPLFSIEVTTEAGSGHNVYQRFARLAASAENDVPTFYIFPEAVVIRRKKGGAKWDKINPSIYAALENMMQIYNIPALLYYFPSHFRADPLLKNPASLKRKGLKYDADPAFHSCPDSRDPGMQALFASINEVVACVNAKGFVDGRRASLLATSIKKGRDAMAKSLAAVTVGPVMSPLSATTTVHTDTLLSHLRRYAGKAYPFGELLTRRPESIVYQVNSKFRGDPYPGALAGIDYLKCRNGRTFEERRFNLVLAWGKVDVAGAPPKLSVSGAKTGIRHFMAQVASSESRNLLGIKRYSHLKPKDIPRYYMQCRYGSTFSKVKHVRVYSYFADVILFPDGALWRDG